MSRACPLCGRPGLIPFLERLWVPVHQNLPLPSRDAAIATPRGDLRLAACPGCGFLTNTAFDPALLSYGATYENDQSCSGRFESYIDGLIEEILADGLRGRRVLEVGCGKGYFISRLCRRGANEGIGVDPTYVGPDTSPDGTVRFVRRFFDESLAGERADAVVCRHVIEHVPDPLSLLAAVHRGLSGRRGVPVYFETPELRWILDGVVVQDFFYEHCSYFTSAALAFAVRRAGFRPERVVHVFDGQYQWIAARSTDPDPGSPPGAADVLRWLDSYRAAEGRVLADWRARLAAAAPPVAVWGAGAKGVTFLNLLDPEAHFIDCIVDVNPRKQGLFVPGTGHPIVAPEALGARGTRTVFLMNPNYEAEVRETLQQACMDAVLHAGSPS
jgi:SAM-dependent methyltransferase